MQGVGSTRLGWDRPWTARQWWAGRRWRGAGAVRQRPEERGGGRGEAEIKEAREWMFLEKRMYPGFCLFLIWMQFHSENC